MVRGRGPFEGTVSAQKALQGSKMNKMRELLEGAKQNHILPDEESLPSRQINDLFKRFKKIAIVAKPASASRRFMIMVRVASLSMSLPFPPLEDSGDPGIWTSLAPVPSNAPPEEGCCPCKSVRYFVSILNSVCKDEISHHKVLKLFPTIEKETYPSIQSDPALQWTLFMFESVYNTQQ